MATTHGRWKLESKSDPRFNMEGDGEVHPFELPQAAESGISLKTQELGSLPPEDLEYSYERDFSPPPTSSFLIN